MKLTSAVDDHTSHSIYNVPLQCDVMYSVKTHTMTLLKV